MKKKLGVFFGGRSCERDVSVLTAMQVFSALNQKKYDVFPVYMDGEWYSDNSLSDVISFKPFVKKAHREVFLKGNTLFYMKRKKLIEIVSLDCALICNHGGEGEDGRLQAVFETAGIPYVSSGVEASAVCMNKARFKQVLSALRYKHTPHLEISSDAFLQNREGAVSAAVKKLGFPMVVKPSSQGSSIGVKTVNARAELLSAIEFAFEFGDSVVTEKLVPNKTELNCAAFCFDGEIYAGAVEKPLCSDQVLSYDDKYIGEGKEGTKRELPAKIDASLSERVRKITMKLYEDFGLSGVVRVDFLYNEESGELFVNEINTVPGSLAFYLFKPCGIEFDTLIDMLIAEAEARSEKQKKFITSFGNGEILSGKVRK